MYRDPRGGHNRKKVNECFFKTWSPQMAYVLGLIYADGAVEDVRQSSRTCYLQLSSIDKELLESVRTSISTFVATLMEMGALASEFQMEGDYRIFKWYLPVAVMSICMCLCKIYVR